MVPGVGVEPTRKYKFRGILSPLCLPISPPGHQVEFSKVCITSFEVVPGVGVEPTRKYKFRGILSPLCLPISPPGQTLAGGAFQSRTELYEFAIRCITALLTRHTLERETRFELATLTMARLCSTN